MRNDELAAVPGFTDESDPHSIPVGPGAGQIEHEFALIFWITASVYCLVLLAAHCGGSAETIIRSTICLTPSRPTNRAIA